MFEGIEIQSKANIERVQNRSGHTIAYLELEMIRARRYASALSLVTIFVPGLKNSDAFNQRQVNMERRLTRIAPKLLRYSDFWGRIDRTGFLLTLTETDVRGAEELIARLTEAEAFQQVVREEGGRDGVSLGAAALDAEMSSAKALIDAARTHVVWNSVAATGPR